MDEAAVDAALCHQFVVSAALDDASVVHYQDLVGVTDGFQPVGDHDDGFLPGQLIDRLHQLFFILRVHVGGGLIQNFEGAAYRETCLRFFKLMCATSLGKICASDHAMNATEEMSALNRDLKKFFDETGAQYPVWQSLEKETGNYLK